MTRICTRKIGLSIRFFILQFKCNCLVSMHCQMRCCLIYLLVPIFIYLFICFIFIYLHISVLIWFNFFFSYDFFLSLFYFCFFLLNVQFLNFHLIWFCLNLILFFLYLLNQKLILFMMNFISIVKTIKICVHCFYTKFIIFSRLLFLIATQFLNWILIEWEDFF